MKSMEETQVVAEAPTQNIAPEAPAQVPEVAEPESEAQEQSQPEATDENDEAKAIKAMQRRISRLTAAKYQAQAEAEMARREAEALRARTQSYEEQPQQQQVDPVALANEIASIREVTARSNKVAEEGAKKFGREEFSKAVNTVIEEAGPLVRPIAPGASVGKPTPLGEAILEADDPAAVLHYLGSNPDVASELSGLGPLQVAKRIARIEIELSKPREPKQSNAPKPVTPVKASNRDDGGLSDNLSPEEWAKRFYKLRRGG